MTTRPLLLLGVLGGCLLGVIGLQLVQPEPAIPSIAAPRRPPVAEATAPRLDGQEWVAQILARPLFAPSRRPPPNEASARAGVAEPPRLSGIMVTPAGRTAIFASGERLLVVREGASLGPFLVESIGEQQVLVQGPSGPRLLRPSFSPDGTPARIGPGTAAAFEAELAPSGLTILQNAIRQLPNGAASPPGVPNGIPSGRLPESFTAGPPSGRPGAPPLR